MHPTKRPRPRKGPWDSVWDIRGKQGRYWIQATAYLSAHDEKTFVAYIDDVWRKLSYKVTRISFGFKSRKSAVQWLRRMKPIIKNQIRKELKNGR